MHFYNTLAVWHHVVLPDCLLVHLSDLIYHSGCIPGYCTSAFDLALKQIVMIWLWEWEKMIGGQRGPSVDLWGASRLLQLVEQLSLPIPTEPASMIILLPLIKRRTLRPHFRPWIPSNGKHTEVYDQAPSHLLGPSSLEMHKVRIIADAEHLLS